MRIAVTSDTHGRYQAALVLLQEKGPFDALLHAGDYYRDTAPLAELLGVAEWRAVTGNCDRGYDPGPPEVSVEWEGFQLLLLHGHRHHAHYTNMFVTRHAKKAGADIVIFGHSHVSQVTRLESLLVINPGSPVNPRQGGAPSAAILELQAGSPPYVQIIE